MKRKTRHPVPVLMKGRLRKAVTAAIMFALASPLFARGGNLMPAGMTSLAQDIVMVFQGPFVKAILAIFLCGSAVAYGFNKDNDKIKRNCIAIGVACAILIAASQIVGSVWEASGGK